MILLYIIIIMINKNRSLSNNIIDDKPQQIRINHHLQQLTNNPGKYQGIKNIIINKEENKEDDNSDKKMEKNHNNNQHQNKPQRQITFQDQTNFQNPFQLQKNDHDILNKNNDLKQINNFHQKQNPILSKSNSSILPSNLQLLEEPNSLILPSKLQLLEESNSLILPSDALSPQEPNSLLSSFNLVNSPIKTSSLQDQNIIQPLNQKSQEKPNNSNYSNINRNKKSININQTKNPLMTDNLMMFLDNNDNKSNYEIKYEDIKNLYHNIFIFTQNNREYINDGYYLGFYDDRIIEYINNLHNKYNDGKINDNIKRDISNFLKELLSKSDKEQKILFKKYSILNFIQDIKEQPISIPITPTKINSRYDTQQNIYVMNNVINNQLLKEFYDNLNILELYIPYENIKEIAGYYITKQAILLFYIFLKYNDKFENYINKNDKKLMVAFYNNFKNNGKLKITYIDYLIQNKSNSLL